MCCTCTGAPCMCDQIKLHVRPSQPVLITAVRQELIWPHLCQLRLSGYVLGLCAAEVLLNEHLVHLHLLPLLLVDRLHGMLLCSNLC